jgi:hypothetical protein
MSPPRPSMPTENVDILHREVAPTHLLCNGSTSIMAALSLHLAHIDADDESATDTPPRYGTPSALIDNSLAPPFTKPQKTTQTTPDVLPPPTPYVHSPTLFDTSSRSEPLNPLLRYQPPYWWPYRTNVKQRWIGRGILEVVSTEFRDRSVDYYVGTEGHAHG